MPAASSLELEKQCLELDAAQRLRLLAWNTLPLLQLSVATLLVLVPTFSWSVRLALVVGWIFVVPALAARLVLARWSEPTRDVPFASDAFFKWWAISNLQALFNRLPMLEEVLRLVPGLYSAWLRLWGARIGRTTFWAPGTRVLDRSFLEIGDDVVLGAGARLSSHLIVSHAEGGMRLQVAPIRIGDGAVVGGCSVLGPGSEIAPREATNACQVLPPFSRWENGRRVRAQTDA